MCFQFTNTGINTGEGYIQGTRYMAIPVLLDIPYIQNQRTFPVHQRHQTGGTNGRAASSPFIDDKGNQQKHENTKQKVVIPDKLEYFLNHGDIGYCSFIRFFHHAVHGRMLQFFSGHFFRNTFFRNNVNNSNHGSGYSIINMTDSSPTVLIVLDGWGHRDQSEGNAIALASTPTWDRLWAHHAHCLISGSGQDVGLPPGQMGNSEVGHVSLGAGRVVHQDFTRITQAIQDGSFFRNPVLRRVMEATSKAGKALHLLGLLSPGGVHSHEDHIKAAVDMARNLGVTRIYLHAFLDGRDVPPRSAGRSLNDLEQHIKAGGVGGIASVIGRYYAMDRDNRWPRIKLAYDLITAGLAEFTCNSPQTALTRAYERDESDEFVQPTRIYDDTSDEMPVTLEDGDAVIFMNFRADRARQLTRSFVAADFNAFDRTVRPALSHFVTLTEYAADISAPVAFESTSVRNSLGEYLASLGRRQLRLAETEKYAHVTFFFSGGREQPFAGEDRLLVPSPQVATYDLQPEMSAFDVTDALVDAITDKSYALIVCNYANGDMVGHTGNLAAAIKAVECIDQCLARIIRALTTANSQCLVTADHGNVEQLNDPDTRQPHTAHTSEKVPLVYIGPRNIKLTQQGGLLSDVAPTILALMDLAQPEEMTGRSLLATEDTPVEPCTA